MIAYFLSYEFLCIELNVFFCIAYHENGALIWYDNGKKDTLSKLERRGTVIKKVEYRITCRQT